MKTLIMSLCFIVSANLFAQDIQLLPPEKEGGKPLMQALSERKSSRSFIPDKELSKQQLSNLLWAANGVNRQERTARTAPSASNCQEIDIYVYLKEGLYLYDAISHSLILKKKGDFRKEAGKQAFAETASVCLTYVGNFDKMPNYKEDQKEFYSATDCGFVSQNVYLYCASEGLGTVVLGMVDKEKVAKLLELKNGKVLLSQVIGFPSN